MPEQDTRLPRRVADLHGYGLLVKLFDSGHVASGLGHLDAIADADGPAVGAQDAGVEPEDQSAPGAGELG